MSFSNLRNSLRFCGYCGLFLFFPLQGISQYEVRFIFLLYTRFFFIVHILLKNETTGQLFLVKTSSASIWASFLFLYIFFLSKRKDYYPPVIHNLQC